MKKNIHAVYMLIRLNIVDLKEKKEIKLILLYKI